MNLSALMIYFIEILAKSILHIIQLFNIYDTFILLILLIIRILNMFFK